MEAMCMVDGASVKKSEAILLCAGKWTAAVSVAEGLVEMGYATKVEGVNAVELRWPWQVLLHRSSTTSRESDAHCLSSLELGNDVHFFVCFL